VLKPSDLHEYQQQSIDYMFENDRAFMIIPMGGGKTVSAATAAVELHTAGLIDEVWVLAPKRVAIDVWGKEFQQWEHLKGVPLAMVVGTPAQRLAAIKRRALFNVTNFDNLQWLEKIIGRFTPRTLVIIDETTRMKNPKGKRAKALLKMLATVKHVFGLTGTPKPKDHLDYFMQVLLVLGPKLWGSNFYVWLAKYFVAHDPDQRMWEPRAGVGSWLDQKFAEACYIVTEDQLGKAYVEPVTVHHKIDLPKAVMAMHDKALRKWILEMPGRRKELLANSAIGSGKARQIASGFVYGEDKVGYVAHTLKLDALKEMVEDIGEPMMICYEFLPELDAICEAFPGIKVIGDGTPDAEISQIIDDWNAGKLDLIAIHPASAGHGLNMQYGGRHMVWFTTPWSSEAYRQTIRRLARQGQTKTVFIHHLIAAGTVEENLVLPTLLGRGEAEDAFKALVARIQNNR
jgi:superfamily II DNA or RNA helicase